MSGTWKKLKKLLGFGPDCKNGGTKLLTGDCKCKKFYDGKLCENVICVNNGTRTEGNRCLCSDPGHIHGFHCELVRCENGGKDTGYGYCKCLDNWYDGRFCENYSSPWGFIFGGVGALIVLFIILCVLCRLKFCSNSPLERPSSDRRRRQRRNRRSEESENSRRIRSSNRGTYTTPPIWPPWARGPNSNEQTVMVGLNPQEPPPYVPKPDEPPPSYEEVITEQHRFPPVLQPLDSHVETNAQNQLLQTENSCEPPD